MAFPHGEENFESIYPKKKTMRVLVAGDYCPQQRVVESFEKKDFESVLGEIKPIVDEADYTIVNFECPVCCGDEKRIEKYGSNLKCSEKGIEALKWVGFDCVTLANNHFCDYGDEGVKITLETCIKYSIDTVGGGINIGSAGQTLYKEIDRKVLAVINCCEHEFSIATNESSGSNPLNPIQQYYAIREAREKADYVLVVVHGGHEHYQLPSLRMREIYRFFIDVGADAIVNHHQHCYSGYEFYNNKPIVYGLGNFCFDEGPKELDLWHIGYLIEIDFNNAINIKVYPYSQCKESAKVKPLTDRSSFDESLKKINLIISDASKLKANQEEYYEKSKISILSMFDPVNLRYVKKAQHRGWLPFFFSRKYLTRIFNYINCEAHRDKLLFVLNQWNQRKL